MTLTDENVAVRGDEDVIRLPEERCVACTARLAQGHEQLAVRRELVDLVSPIRRSTRRAWGHRRARAVRHPDIAVLVDGNSVRRREHPGAKVRDQGSVRIELEHRIERRPDATVRST